MNVLYFLPVKHDENHYFNDIGGSVRLRGSSLFLRGISLVFLFLTAVVTVVQVVQYSISRANYPPDMTIGGVPVGGLNPQSAAQRIEVMRESA